MTESPPEAPPPPVEWSATLSDAALLEQYLKPWEDVIDQIQAMLFWRNALPMLLLLGAANLLFFVIYKLDISSVPTVFLLLALRTAFEIIYLHFGSILTPALFPKIENRYDGSYVIYPLEDVSKVLVFFTSRAVTLWGKLQPRGAPTATVAQRCLGFLVVLLVCLYFTGTFWLNFALVNGALLLPAVAMHRVFRPLLARLILG